jgi:hypothetical protein
MRHRRPYQCPTHSNVFSRLGAEPAPDDDQPDSHAAIGCAAEARAVQRVGVDDLDPLGDRNLVGHEAFVATVAVQLTPAGGP